MHTLRWLLPAGLLRSVTATSFFLESGLDDPIRALRGDAGVSNCGKVFKADDMCVAREVCYRLAPSLSTDGMYRRMYTTGLFNIHEYVYFDIPLILDRLVQS